jgi:hypothetical protein
VAGYLAKQHDEMQAVADALSLLANLVMAWNTMKMQLVLDRWNTRRSTTVPSELIGRIAPTRTEGINQSARRVLAFPSSNTLNNCCRHWRQHNHGLWVPEQTQNAP